MKDNLFELLLNLFEQSLSKLQKSQEAGEEDALTQLNEDELIDANAQPLHIQSAQHSSTRVLTYEEQMKLTKASYQFLMRMKQWGVIDSEVFELVVHQLQFSESRIVMLQETKWTIRNVLASSLSEKQLSFLDLVLYQTEDAYIVH